MKKTMGKKILSLLLCAVLLMGNLPVSAFAEEAGQKPAEETVQPVTTPLPSQQPVQSPAPSQPGSEEPTEEPTKEPTKEAVCNCETDDPVYHAPSAPFMCAAMPLVSAESPALPRA